MSQAGVKPSCRLGVPGDSKWGMGLMGGHSCQMQYADVAGQQEVGNGRVCEQKGAAEPNASPSTAAATQSRNVGPGEGFGVL